MLCVFVPRPVPCLTPSPVLTFSSSGRGETAHGFLLGLWPRRSTKRWASPLARAGLHNQQQVRAGHPKAVRSTQVR